MNKKIVFNLIILLICILGLISSSMALITNTYLFQYIGLSHNLSGFLNALISIVVFLVVIFSFWLDRKRK